LGIVGAINNVLQPALVGHEAQMSDLMIFVSTLRGLAMFGAMPTSSPKRLPIVQQRKDFGTIIRLTFATIL
jgi:hypothetical protein